MIGTLLLVAFVVYIVYKVSWAALRRYLISTTTVLNELQLLGGSPPPHKIPGTAVIAGGSFSGYIFARILADYFEKIILIDPEAAISYQGRVPQRAHFHALLAVSLPILRKLFANFDEEAAKNDIYLFPAPKRWWLGRAYFGDLSVNLPLQVTGSRFSVETLCRRLSMAYCADRLQVIQGTVTSIEASSDETTIRSVSFRPTSESGMAPTPVPCALFVDCSGSSSIGPKLLSAASKQWGPYGRVSYNPKVKYYSVTVQLPPATQEKVTRVLPESDQDFGRWDACGVVGVFTPTPHTTREGFVYQRVDRDHLLILYAGWGFDSCPKTFAQYAEVTRQLHADVFPEGCHSRDAWLFEFIRLVGEGTNPLDEPIPWHSYTLNSCYWNDYKSKRIPNNFVAVGDSLMRVNPIFGQGITKLLGDCTVLNATLYKAFKSSVTPELPPGFSRSYFKTALSKDMAMFDIARMLDYGFDSTIPAAHETLEFGKTFRSYWEALLNFIPNDAKSFELLVSVLGGYKPGIDLMNPWLVIRSLFWMWWSPPKSAQE